jgi:hypothetical protein
LPGAPLFEDIATPTTELRSDAGDWSPLPTLEAIFDEYVALRARCGENTGVNRDRFLTKLEENRRTTITQQGCRDVRFEVYEKAGRAAVRAVPVR